VSGWLLAHEAALGSRAARVASKTSSKAYGISDGTPYGGAVSAPRSDISEKVFRGLRWLGFEERDARGAIQAALREAGTASRELAHDDAGLLRRALAHLG